MAEAAQRRRGRPLKQAIQECEAKWFQETLAAAHDGEPNQMALLGHMYSVGYGCQPDPQEAQRWFEEANKRLGYNVMTEHPQQDQLPQQDLQQQHQQLRQPGSEQVQHQHHHHHHHHHHQQQAQQDTPLLPPTALQQHLPDLPQQQQQQPQQQQIWPAAPSSLHGGMLAQDDRHLDAQEMDQQKASRLPRLQAAPAASVIGGGICPPVTSHLYREAELHTLKQGQQQQA